MIQDILAPLAIILLGISHVILSSLLNRSRYRIKEIENTYIPQVRKGLSWYSLNNSNTSLYYDQAINERSHCRCGTMDEAIKVLNRYKESTREKEVKYHKYN
jgi:hypothetical protein